MGISRITSRGDKPDHKPSDRPDHLVITPKGVFAFSPCLGTWMPILNSIGVSRDEPNL